MADLLSDDTDHTVNTIQKEQVDCSRLLFFQCKIYHFKAYETAASAPSCHDDEYTKMYDDKRR